MSDFKIAITAGHYFGTPGKRCLKTIDPNETREWILNDRIADKIEALLSQYTGYKLLRTDDTSGKKAENLTARTNAANKFGADFYLSIHHNAGVKGGTGGGIQAYVYNKLKSNDEAFVWQKELYNNLIKHTGLKGNRSVPCPTANFHEVRETKMPAVLLELGFMDSKTDVPIILSEDFANKCALAIVEVLVARGNLKKKEEPKVEPPKPVVTPTAKTYKVVTKINGYNNAADAKNQKSKITVLEPGTYYIFNKYPNGYKNGMWNITKDPTGAKAGSWINPAENVVKPASTGVTVLEFQKAAIADGFKFPRYGADGEWGTECASVATKAIVKKYVTYKYKNLTKIVQRVVGVTQDGLCGNNTVKAIKAWQSQNGLTADGCIGLASWKKILGIK